MCSVMIQDSAGNTVEGSGDKHWIISISVLSGEPLCMINVLSAEWSYIFNAWLCSLVCMKPVENLDCASKLISDSIKRL